MSVEQFRELPKEERDRYYADVDTQRAAADEYVAFTGEDGRYNNAGRWEKVLTWLREKLRKLGFKIKFSDADIMRLLRRSDSAMEKRGDKPSEFGGEDKSFRIATDEKDFAEMWQRAKDKVGNVRPELSSLEFEIIEVTKHDFTGTGKQALEKAKAWAAANLVGDHTIQRGDLKGVVYSIDDDAIGKYLSGSSTTNSENLGVHLAVLKMLPEIIDNSIDVEQHIDYKKEGGDRSSGNGVDNSKILIHRLYGAIRIDGQIPC
jgi:hypothetical protein